MYKNELDAIFHPKRVAVIGASRNPGSVGHSLLANLIDSRYQGIVYPVNPGAEGILGIQCFPDVLSIPGPVDLAVIIVRAKLVPHVLEQCGKKKIKGAIIISAGFKEIGQKGQALEEEVKKIIQKHNILTVGPNCLGVMSTSPKTSMNATFGTQMPAEGNITLISQSGALCIAILDYAKEANIGFSKFISMGNKAGLTENDLLRYLKHDPNTDVILMYLEDLVDGREFMSIAREITTDPENPKPILALKAGRTLLGAKAASSHTGSLAGSDRVYDAIFTQSGVIRGETLEELFDQAKAFASQPLPKGKNTVIVGNSGGPGILATDSCIQYGLDVPELNPNIITRLKQSLPSSITIANPLDLVAEAQYEQYETALGETLKDKSIQSAIVILTPTAFTDVEKIARAIVRVSKRYRKPLVCCFLGIYDVSTGIEILEENQIPAYRFPETTAKVLAEMYDYTQWLSRPKTEVKTYDVNKRAAQKIIKEAMEENRTFLMEHEAYEILKAYEFPVIQAYLSRSPEEAAEFSAKIGFPVALKIASPDVLHKFDFGGVELDIETPEQASEAFQEIKSRILKKKPSADIRGILVEKMAKSGKEIILGMNHDPQFGPILMFGMGGIYVEALEDVTFRLAPIRELTAQMMISKTKTHKILNGYRGGPIYDIKAIEECLKRLSQLVVDQQSIKELDINPLIVYEKGKGCAIVDARIILHKQ